MKKFHTVTSFAKLVNKIRLLKVLFVKKKAFRTIRSHGTKSHILGRKLHSGTSKTTAGQGVLVQLCFGSPAEQLAFQHV